MLSAISTNPASLFLMIRLAPFEQPFFQVNLGFVGFIGAKDDGYEVTTLMTMT